MRAVNGRQWPGSERIGPGGWICRCLRRGTGPGRRRSRRRCCCMRWWPPGCLGPEPHLPPVLVEQPMPVWLPAVTDRIPPPPVEPLPITIEPVEPSVMPVIEPAADSAISQPAPDWEGAAREVARAVGGGVGGGGSVPSPRMSPGSSRASGRRLGSSSGRCRGSAPPSRRRRARRSSGCPTTATSRSSR